MPLLRQKFKGQSSFCNEIADWLLENGRHGLTEGARNFIFGLGIEGDYYYQSEPFGGPRPIGAPVGAPCKSPEPSAYKGLRQGARNFIFGLGIEGDYYYPSEPFGGPRPIGAQVAPYVRPWMAVAGPQTVLMGSSISSSPHLYLKRK